MNLTLSLMSFYHTIAKVLKCWQDGTTMMLVIILLLGLLTLLAVSLQKTYNHVPPHELKRRAQRGDENARLLYQAVAYGTSLDLVLWIIIGLSSAGFFIALTRSMTAWLAFFGCVAVIWFGFAWLPNSRLTGVGEKVAHLVTPFVAWLMRQLHPLVNKAERSLSRFHPITVHTGLYEKEDLLNVINQQKIARHNRIDTNALEMAAHALTLGDKLIREHMTPRRAVKLVNAKDSIGPVLLDELHKSGLSRFPVVGNEPDQIVGTLYLHDLVDHPNGQVKDIMSKSVYYVHEEKTLGQVLDAFIKTKHHLFVVVNNFEEIVGVISIEDVIEALVGKQIVDEFDQYESLRAVASKEAKKDHTEAAEPVESTEPKATEKA